MWSIFRLSPKAKIPIKATEGSACYDLEFCVPDSQEELKGYSGNQEITISPRCKWHSHKTWIIDPGNRVLVPTSLIIDIPIGYHVKIFSRSSMAFKRGLFVANSVGIIDSDYVEQLYVMLYNAMDVPVILEEGDRIAQMMICKNTPAILSETLERPQRKTSRDGGIGSTGK